MPTFSQLPNDKWRAQVRRAGIYRGTTFDTKQREIGRTPLASLSAVTLHDFLDRRLDAGAGGVTVAADLSFLSAVLKWARHARHLDLNERLAIQGRAGLSTAGFRRAGQSAIASQPMTSSSCSTRTGAATPASASTW